MVQPGKHSKIKMNDVKFLLAVGYFYRLAVGLALGSMSLQGSRAHCNDEGLLRWVSG